MQTSVEFDYGQLDGESRIVVQQRTSELKSLIRRSAQDIIEIGLRLSEVKVRLGHGRFGAWLAAEFHWSPDTALNFMRVAERFGQNPNISEFAPSALYLLAAPAASDAACREALARAEAGERISVPVAQAIIREHRPAPPPYAAVWELETGLRSWLARQTSGRAAQPLRAAEQIALLDSICRRTTAGLIAFDDLLAVLDLPEPRRKGDMIQAVNNVLAQLRQAEAGGLEQEAEVREEVIGVKDPDPWSLMLAPAATMGISGGLAVAQVAPATGDLAMGPADPRAETLIDVGLVTIVRGDSRRLTKYVAPGTAHLAITSPPYNVAKDYSAHDDNLPAADYWALLKAVFGECHRALVEGGRIAVVVPFGTGRKPWIPLAAPVGELLTELGFTPRGMIIWDKGTCGNRTTWGSFRLPSDPALRDRTEAIVVAHKGSGYLPLPADVVQHDDKGSYSAWLPGELFLALTQDLWQVAPESAQRIGHPAPFPVELAERLLRLYGYPGCHVVDPFGGSGTVGVAAQKLGCRATLIDIDAGYCELAAQRCKQENCHQHDFQERNTP